MQVNILEAKNQLSRLVHAAQNGEDVIIAKSGIPAVRLTPIRGSRGLKGWGRLKKAGPIDNAFTEQAEKTVRKLLLGK